jgi:hypothetical protein
MGDAHSACHNSSPGVALPISSCPVDPLCASSGFLCIDKSEIRVYHLNPQLELQYHGKYRAPLRAVDDPIHKSCYDWYASDTPACHGIL